MDWGGPAAQEFYRHHDPATGDWCSRAWRIELADLRFAPDPRECSLCPPTGCDLRCVWPSDEPKVWEGDYG